MVIHVSTPHYTTVVTSVTEVEDMIRSSTKLEEVGGCPGVIGSLGAATGVQWGSVDCRMVFQFS